MVKTKVDEQGVEFIVWARRNKWKITDVLEELANQDIKVSAVRIGQLYVKNKSNETMGLVNPYNPEMEPGLSAVNLSESDQEKDDPTSIESFPNEIPTFQTENEGSYMIDLKPILTNAGIRGAKNTQVIKLFEKSNGTPVELVEVLHILGVGLTNQKQVIAQAFSMDVMKQIYGHNSKVKSTSSAPSSNGNNPQAQMNNLINQRLAAMSNRIALKDAEATLKELDSKVENGGDDLVKSIKEIHALKSLQGDNNNNNSDLINKLILEKFKSEDNQLLKAIELIEKLRGTGSKEEDIKLKYLMDETKQLRESSEKSKDQYLKAESEKMNLILAQIKETAQRDHMSFEDYTNQIAHSVSLAQKMGMVEGGNNDQKDAIGRLNAGTQLAETFSAKIDTGIDKLGERLESGIGLLVTLFEKRDQRLEEKYNKQNNTGLRDLPARSNVSINQREQDLNNIGSSLQNVERLRAIHSAFSQIKQS